MDLENFFDLSTSMKEDLPQIVYSRVNWVEVDLDLTKISKIELFRMGLNGGQWEEKEPGVFKIG